MYFNDWELKHYYEAKKEQFMKEVEVAKSKKNDKEKNNFFGKKSVQVKPCCV